jgi:uncharacterized lipoprotein NlpE involved in copper resistance
MSVSVVRAAVVVLSALVFVLLTSCKQKSAVECPSEKFIGAVHAGGAFAHSIAAF